MDASSAGLYQTVPRQRKTPAVIVRDTVLASQNTVGVAPTRAHLFTVLQMNEALIEPIQFIGHGAVALFASSYVADSLADEHDLECNGERVIATELLSKERNAAGFNRFWFNPCKLVELVRKDRVRDLIDVFNTMDNLDMGIAECYTEGGGDTESLLWRDFLQWRIDTSRALREARKRKLLTMLHMVVRVKVYAIRFRSRVHAPNAALYRATMKRLRAH